MTERPLLVSPILESSGGDFYRSTFTNPIHSGLGAHLDVGPAASETGDQSQRLAGR
jgi:hypothetical protein